MRVRATQGDLSVHAIVGTHVALLSNGQKLQVSRLQSRVLRERFLLVGFEDRCADEWTLTLVG